MIPFLEILETLTHVTLTENVEFVMAAMLLGELLGTEDYIHFNNNHEKIA